ncbi:hypothetical protein [Nitrospina watsonii]|uniref:Uncharacterized protein n=1 Tax=Nitrospina watsonii TaxID=1323948 RepID=A0ABM9HCT7_9BACT|nr:hypothetical protein [Nitrospina watsonii]CAI2717928.1 conserved protein of unknown function [Nitrospina watsonii]
MPQSEPDGLTQQRLDDLHAVSQKLNIDVQYTQLDDSEYPVASGHCKVHGRDLILLDKTLPPGQHIEIILNVLKTFDLETIYVPGWIREHIHGPEQEFPSP